MTNGLSDKQAKTVTYLVYFLLAILTILMAWQTIVTLSHGSAIACLPDKYVRLERYQSDQLAIRENQKAIMDKLDRLIENL